MSAGNHAQGVAYHARRLGIRAMIVMPETTPFVKIESTRKLGAEVVLEGDDIGRCGRACAGDRPRAGPDLHPSVRRCGGDRGPGHGGAGDSRTSRPRRAGGARWRPPARRGRRRLEHLQRHRALAGDDGRVVEGVDEGQAFLGRSAWPSPPPVEVVALEHDVARPSRRVFSIFTKGVKRGHHDRGRDAEAAAWKATPWAWLPADIAITPRRPASSGSSTSRLRRRAP